MNAPQKTLKQEAEQPTPNRQGSFEGLRSWIHPLGLALGVSFFILIPLGLVLLQSMVGPRGLRILAFLDLLGDKAFVRSLGNTLLLGVLVLLTSTIIALPLGMIRTRTPLVRHHWVDTVVMIPFLTPPFINSQAWIMFMQPRGYLQSLFPMIPDLSGWFFSLAGLVLVMSLHIFPFLYLLLKNALEKLSGSLDDSARMHGAGAWYTFFRITIPLLVGPLAIGALLVMVKTFSEFGTPITIGRRIGFPVMVTDIFRYTSNWPLNFPKAASYSLYLLGISLFMWYLQGNIAKKNSFHGNVKSLRPPRLSTGRAIEFFSWLYLIVLLVVAVGVPYFSMAATSLVNLLSVGLSWTNLTLQHYIELLAPGSAGLQALGWSLLLSLGSATLAAFLGTWIGLASQNPTRAGGVMKYVDFLALSPNTVPSIIVVIGLILMWNAVWMPKGVYNTPWMLVVTYTILFLPFTVQYVKAARQEISPSLIHAAKVSGASSVYILYRITLPLVKKAILAGWIMTFAISFRELVGSLVIRPPSIHTTATFLYGQFEQGSVGLGMAMSLVSVLATTGIILMVQGWSRPDRVSR